MLSLGTLVGIDMEKARNRTTKKSIFIRKSTVKLFMQFHHFVQGRVQLFRDVLVRHFLSVKLVQQVVNGSLELVN